MSRSFFLPQRTICDHRFLTRPPFGPSHAPSRAGLLQKESYPSHNDQGEDRHSGAEADYHHQKFGGCPDPRSRAAINNRPFHYGRTCGRAGTGPANGRKRPAAGARESGCYTGPAMHHRGCPACSIGVAAGGRFSEVLLPKGFAQAARGRSSGLQVRGEFAQAARACLPDVKRGEQTAQPAAMAPPEGPVS